MAAALRFAAKSIFSGALKRSPQAFHTATRTIHGGRWIALGRPPFSPYYSILPPPLITNQVAGVSSKVPGYLVVMAILAPPVIMLLPIRSMTRRRKAEEERERELMRQFRRGYGDGHY